MGCNDLYTFRNSKKLHSSFNTQTRQVSGVLTDIYTCRGAKNSREKHGGGEKQRIAAGGKSGVEGSALRQDSNKWKMGRLSFPLVKHAASLESRTWVLIEKLSVVEATQAMSTFGLLDTSTFGSIQLLYTAMVIILHACISTQQKKLTIKHFRFLIWNEKPRVSLLMNKFFLRRRAES